MKSVVLTFLSTSSLAISLFVFYLSKHDLSPKMLVTTAPTLSCPTNIKTITKVKERIVYKTVKPKEESVNVWIDVSNAFCKHGAERVSINLITGKKHIICNEK